MCINEFDCKNYGSAILVMGKTGRYVCIYVQLFEYLWCISILLFWCFRYKDNRPYPWPSGVSNMILYPESANQTIYTQMVTATDTGNYTCVLRNDTHVRTHTIHLHVFSKYSSIHTRICVYIELWSQPSNSQAINTHSHCRRWRLQGTCT